MILRKTMLSPFVNYKIFVFFCVFFALCVSTVNPVRELRSLTGYADGGIRPPSAFSGNDRRFQSAAFSNGVNAELTAQEIVKRSDDLMRGDTCQGRYVMTVTTPHWTRRLELDVWAEGRDKTFIRIISPAKETGITTLRIKNNMWNYLPKVERTIKIPPSMMFQPWMGSDFTNDDLVKENSIVYDYNHTLLGEEIFEGNLVYKLKLIPKPQATVIWGKLIFRIRKEDFIPLREEYYSEKDKLIKVLNYSEVKKVSDRIIPTLWEMAPLTKEGCRTTIELVEVKYNQPIDENIFTLENLRRF